MSSINVIMTIAKKEFADKLHEKSIVIMMAMFMVTLFVYTQTSFSGVARIIGVFFPLLGIAIGYDAIVGERNSKTLNVLLTHPVFRDNLIVGKLLGMCMVIFSVVFISLTLMMAADFLITGKVVQFASLYRLYFFGLIIFLYLLIYACIGLISSILCKIEVSSLAFGVVIWINLCFALGSTIIMLSSLITGSSMFDGAEEFKNAYATLIYPSPLHHFAAISLGIGDLSYESIAWQPSIRGIMDSNHSFSYLIEYYFDNLLYLILLPIFLFVISYISFIREDL